ncbi:MAG: GNAT family N-acetyltransferase [Beijerinckiaceae bacterium]
MGWTIHPVSDDERPALLDLWVQSWSEVYPVIDFNARRPWFSSHIIEWLSEGGFCYQAREQPSGRMAGFVMVKPATGHLDQICVAIPHKGKGVAAALMGEARRLCPEGLHLDVNATNSRAIHFYEKQGFIKTGEGVNPSSGLPLYRYHWQL